jgi:hypothetical protein
MSSTTPLQSSSIPLHTSPVAAPGVALQVVLVPEHTTVPVRAHAPTPTLHDPPVGRHVPPQFDCPAGQPHAPAPLHTPPEMLEHGVPDGSLEVWEQNGPAPPEQ